MADRTKIEWADATVNAINGCTLVDQGCRNCYAARLAGTRMKSHPTRAGLARQNAAGEFKFTGEVRLNEKALLQPLSWQKPRTIFWNAHGDTFHENVPDEWIDRMMAVIALTPQHRHMVLTKRSERARVYLGERPASLVRHQIAALGKIFPTRRDILVSNGEAGRMLPLPNLWLGTSVSDQASADARIPQLLAAPAAVRFVSAEPLLGPVRLDHINTMIFRGAERVDALDGYGYGMFDDVASCRLPKIDQVIVGGESGPGARPMHPDWARSLRDQCQAAGVAFFFKQHGEQVYLSERAVTWGCSLEEADARLKAFPHQGAFSGKDIIYRVGKARAGRLLDGREWSEVPA